MSAHTSRQVSATRTTRIEASPRAAFDAVNTPEIAPLIDPGVRLWQPDTNPIAVGTRFTIRGKLGILPIRGVSETVTWDPPYRVVYHSVKPTWPLRMEAEHRFEPDGNRHAVYTWSITFIERNPIARPIIAVALRLFRTAMTNQASALSAYLAEPGSNGLPNDGGDT
jgi:Polyketide cyclase / dehydrase and lipid transport